MERIYHLFHYLSYFQYPFLLIGLYYSFKPNIFGNETIWSDFNFCLIFMGLALSFTSLADIRKKNKISKKVFGNPRYAKIYLIYLMVLIVIILSAGLYALLITEIEPLKELATGIIVLGIGVIGLLKMSIEMAKHIMANAKMGAIDQAE